MSSPSCNSLETQELRTELLQRLAELDEETRAMKSRYNALAPTTHVPTEVLSHIFLFLRDELSEDLLSDSTDSLRQSWIRITRVCHHWREVALGCPALWTDLRFSHPGLTRAMIQRSGSFPLTVIFDERSSKGMSLDLHDALSEAHRLQSVQLRFQSSNSQFYFKEWHGETPLLKDLSIETVPEASLIYWPFWHSPKEIPSLRSLRVSQCSLPWSVLPLGPNLTSLKLSQNLFRTVDASRPWKWDFFATLRNMVNIQDLHLDWRSIPNGLIHSHYPMVLFPALRTLKLADEISVVSGFLSVFRIPEDACVNISCYKDLEDPTSVNLFLLKLREAWPKLQMGAQSLRLVESWGSTTAGINYLTNSDEDESLTSAGVEKPFANLDEHGLSEIDDLQLQFHNSCCNLKQLIGSFTEHVDLSPLQHLRVDGLDTDHDTWEVFSRLQTLRTVTLACTAGDSRASRRPVDITGFVSALLGSQDAQPNSGTESKQDCPPPFPALVVLEFTGLDLKNRITSPFAPRLLKALASRQGITPFKRLEINQCTMDMEDNNLLRAGVPGVKIVWNRDHFLDYDN